MPPVPPTANEIHEAHARPRLIAFDLDGTLVDSAPDLNHCLGAALATVGFGRPTEAQTRSWIGDGVEELIRRGLAHLAPSPALSEQPHVLSRAQAAFSACYEQNLFVRSRLYPGVARTLDALRGAGLRLCCITNKRLRFAEGVLEQAGIRERFELVLGGDSLGEKKPSGAQLEAASSMTGVPADAAVFVGDSDHDMRAAAAAGWRFVWAAYGYRASLAASRPATLVSIAGIAELVDLLLSADD